MAFYLPVANAVLMELPATVAWINEEGKRVKSSLPPGFGVEFQDLDEQELAVLNAFLDAEQLSRNGAGAP